ncbi:hypothetical protein NDU88_012785 [Pleurodeles waltl]|uniref:Uncharacterized protein n=1 Tax=Pleurodeles waltl TaxID=8319 RepID=A0AAV7R5E5_PLEWA|nr:hypothetical protein NDU88_012785 [Pleurodeles waltl]
MAGERAPTTSRVYGRRAGTNNKQGVWQESGHRPQAGCMAGEREPTTSRAQGAWQASRHRLQAGCMAGERALTTSRVHGRRGGTDHKQGVWQSGSTQTETTSS